MSGQAAADEPKSQLTKHGVRIVDHVFEGDRAFAETEHPTIWGYLSPVVGEVTVGRVYHPMRVYHVGDLRLTAPGTPLRRVADRPATIRAVSLPDHAFTAALGPKGRADCGTFAPLQRHAFRSPVVAAVIEQLRMAGAQRDRLSPLYVDAMLSAVVMELWRLSGDGDDAENPCADRGPTLAPELLRRIYEMIDDDASQRVEIASLAALAQMPVAAFQRAFKEATGDTPYQHLLKRRLARARELVARSATPLSEIAYRCGFASQSHMTDQFRAKFGATPGRIRRAHS
ncbi:MAG: AraC family transcriptional regulator [Pseudomonadota bacterium]